MRMVGRQMARSSTTAHHHRQYSDNLLDPSFNGKWLQSSNFSASQDLGLYGGAQASRRCPDPATPPGCSRPFGLRQNEDELVSPSEFSPGLLDLHSFDTELLPEVPSIYEGYQIHQPGHAKGFDDSESFLNVHKLADRPHCLPESSLLRSFSTDKERANNVAKIKVVVRKRPMNKKETAKKEEDIIKIEPNSNSLTVHERKLKVDLTEYVEKHDFVFDAVLDEDVRNDEVYSETVEPIVPLIFNRTKATCFAYGQTGSGKTYTMQPLPLKASQDILNLMYYQYRNQGFQLFVSFFEIYGGKVFDLLNDRKKLCMREDGKQQVCIVGLQEYKVVDVEAIKELIEKGNAARSTGTTGANEESSRSHAILQLAIKRSPDGSDSKPPKPKPIGKLSFIDLAGSERGADTTDNDKQTRMEGAEINKSLLALKECIRALDNDQGHIPFRGSKLTEVLRDSFVGDSRTVMISCISPGSGSCEHTLNTLRYADRVKSLSKGNNSKKDPLSAPSSFRDSTTLLHSSVPPEPSLEDNIADVSYGRNKFGWSKQAEIEASPPLKIDRVPSGRGDGSIVASVLNAAASDTFDYSESNRQGKVSSKNYTSRLPIYQKAFLETRPKSEAPMKGIDPPLSGLEESQTDDDLNALLKEEEDLVSAHRQQVEETMDIVKEEMSLLMEADRPGNQLDKYICKLNGILSQKAAGVLQLQARLVHFQKRLDEYNVLLSSTN